MVSVSAIQYTLHWSLITAANYFDFECLDKLKTLLGSISEETGLHSWRDWNLSRGGNGRDSQEVKPLLEDRLLILLTLVQCAL